MEDFVVPIIAVIAVGSLIFLFAKRYKSRYQELLEKYGKPDVAKAIMNRRLWVGETAQQLGDSLGKPYEVDTKVTAGTNLQDWIYVRYRVGSLRIHLQNGIVTGWEKKSLV